MKTGLMGSINLSGLIFVGVLLGACMVAGLTAAAERPKPPPARTEKSIHARPWVFGQSADRASPLWRKGVTADSIVKEASTKTEHKQRAQHGESHNPKSSLEISVQKETGTWKVAPIQKAQSGGENMARDKRHVVRAFAHVEAADDLNISLGPELILKDESHAEGAAASEQPETSFGVGMKFKYDF